MTDPLPQLVRTVALRHQPPGEAAHYDWMWTRTGALPGPDERVLTTFRLHAPPLEAGVSFEATRLPDHRARYLWYEGDIGRGRGVVTRVWASVARLIRDEPGGFLIETPDASGVISIEGRPAPCHTESSQERTYACVARRLDASEPWPVGPRTPA